MMKVRVNRFGPIGCLTTFNFGKIDTVAIDDPIIHLNYTVLMFQYGSTHSKFQGTLKAENSKLVINGKAITILQEEILPTSKEAMLVLICGGVH